MAGRLYYVSYVLEELGEDDMAADVSRLIKGDVIDELLEAFRSFANEHHKGRGVSIHLALKAGQVIAKLQRSFEGAELAHIIDPALVRRAARLFSSYTTMLRGSCPPRELSECDLVRHLEALVVSRFPPAPTMTSSHPMTMIQRSYGCSSAGLVCTPSFPGLHFHYLQMRNM